MGGKRKTGGAFFSVLSRSKKELWSKTNTKKSNESKLQLNSPRIKNPPYIILFKFNYNLALNLLFSPPNTFLLPLYRTAHCILYVTDILYVIRNGYNMVYRVTSLCHKGDRTQLGFDPPTSRSQVSWCYDH